MTNKQTSQTQTTAYPNIVLQNIENLNSYHTRIIEMIEKSDDYLKDFYEESPNYTYNKEFVNKLIWLTYSDKEKKHILDKELEEYFN